MRARSSNPECHGPYDWRFPRYCNSGAPKALEHCDGEANGSRLIRWLGGASESRVLEEHRERNKERNRRAAEHRDRRERPTTGKYPWRLFLRKERRRLSLLKASQRALQAHACRGSSSDLPVPIRPDAVLTESRHGVRDALAAGAALSFASHCAGDGCKFAMHICNLSSLSWPFLVVHLRHGRRIVPDGAARRRERGGARGWRWHSFFV